MCGDLNGHVGESTSGFDGIHGGHGFGTRNTEGTRILDFCTAANFAVANTFFVKEEGRLITYRSGKNQSQVDYIFVRRNDLRFVRDTKVINGEECAPQHKLLVADIHLYAGKVKPKVIPVRRCVWKLKKPKFCEQYHSQVQNAVDNTSFSSNDVEIVWKDIKSCVIDSFDATCGWSKANQQRKETWWWNDDVESSIKEKRRLWKEWKKGGSKELYLAAKRRAKHDVYIAKKAASEANFDNLHEKDKLNHVFKMARKMKLENQDIVGDKCIRDDDGNIAYDDDAKLKAWKNHYEKLLNEEFPWNEAGLSDALPVEGPAIHIPEDMVASAIQHMKLGKAAGPSGIVVEMLKAAGACIIPHLCKLINLIIFHHIVPDDWDHSFIINLFKGKGDSLDRGNFRGLKLLEVVQKVMERVMEGIIRAQIHIDNMQFGFMPGRGTTDAIFILRQLQEKYVGKHKELFLAFVDLEKAFDRIPRKVLWWAMRKIGIAEWIITTVQAMYNSPRSSVRVNGSYSTEFPVDVGVHQGSVLSPVLFIIVMEALSCEFRTSCPWELLYADDLVIAAESQEELERKLSLWKREIELKGLRVNMKKTKIMHSRYGTNQRRKTGKWPCGVCLKGVGINSIFCTTGDHWVHKRCSGIKGRLKHDDAFVCVSCKNPALAIIPDEFLLDGVALEVVPTFCYLGDVLGDTGGCIDAITARVQSAWKKFRELLPILTNRGISLMSRGRVFSAGVRGVLLHASETWPLTVEASYRLERNDNAMVRWICATKITDNISMAVLRDRLGIASLDVIMRRGRLRWFGHISRMEESCWQKKMLTFEVDGVHHGRPKKRWSENIKTDMKKLNISEELTTDRVAWRAAIRGDNMARRRPTPATGKRRRETVQ